MPRYKYVANRALTVVENLLMHQKLSEYHTGLRAYSRGLLAALPLDRNSDDFVFDNQIIAQAFAAGARIGELSCPTRYHAEASSIGLARSIRYGIGVLRTAAQYRLQKNGLRSFPYLEVSSLEREARPPTPAASTDREPGARPALRVVRCSRTALGRPARGVRRLRRATTYPPPDDAELRSAYAGSYRPPSGRFSGGGDRVLRRTRGLLAGGSIDGRRQARSSTWVRRGRAAGRAGVPGRVAVGLEQGDQAAHARLDVREVEMVDFDDRQGEWAAVVFWHSLEHLREPRAALRRAWNLLATSGLLVVAVPNRASWQARWLGDRWLALDLPRHLVHLPAEALVEGVRECGLKIDRVSYWRGGQVMFGWLDGLVSMLPSRPSLYDAIRQAEARATAMSRSRRGMTLAAGAALTPVAIVLAAAEVAAQPGGASTSKPDARDAMAARSASSPCRSRRRSRTPA